MYDSCLLVLRMNTSQPDDDQEISCLKRLKEYEVNESLVKSTLEEMSET